MPVMSFKCPNCGASISEDSQFCKYCGAKIDDGVKRMEIKVDQRIEDVAEVRRASYEEQESLLRQKRMQQEFRRVKAKRITLLVLLGIFLIPTIIGFAHATSENAAGTALCFFGAIGIGLKILYDLIRGKW